MYSFGNIFDMNMDKEQIVLAVVTIVSLGIVAFIIWGPNPRPRRSGSLVGLQNLGLTCFLNTLLQALASCPIFIEWIEACQDQGSVALSLYYLLKVLSSLASVEDPLDPSLLIEALKHHGWSISPGEQDAHELFHLIMATLEEEAHKAIPNDGGLSDCLEPTIERRDHSQDATLEKNESCEPHAELESKSLGSTDEIVNLPSGDALLQTQSLPPSHRIVNKHGQLISRNMPPKYDCNRNYQGSPFCGLLTSQLLCVECGFKSVVRYDKFDSLSLHLPDSAQPCHSLCQLLERYTRAEPVQGVACGGCNKHREPDQPPVTSTSLKTIAIGKLPRCLCIHIHRMSMCGGTPYKRWDYVDFPEFLTMDPYTHNAMIKDQKNKADLSSDESHESEDSASKTPPNRTRTSNHVYRIKAVVVHCGSVDGGHFVTYRRGPLRSDTRHRSDRWYFTSDETVRDATLAEAMQASAYMLFYEKCTFSLT